MKIETVKPTSGPDTRTPRFWNFRQNNSGGDFHVKPKQGISVNVIVEAYSLADANRRAEEIGLYFDGCRAGRDCHCCGDRWNEQYDDKDGTAAPTIYGAPIADYFTGRFVSLWAGGEPEVFVHYLDGRIEAYTPDPPKPDASGGGEA